jgi:hypothetical protein
LRTARIVISAIAHQLGEEMVINHQAINAISAFIQHELSEYYSDDQYEYQLEVYDEDCNEFEIDFKSDELNGFQIRLTKINQQHLEYSDFGIRIDADLGGAGWEPVNAYDSSIKLFWIALLKKM